MVGASYYHVTDDPAGARWRRLRVNILVTEPADPRLHQFPIVIDNRYRVKGVVLSRLDRDPVPGCVGKQGEPVLIQRIVQQPRFMEQERLDFSRQVSGPTI